MWKFWGVLTHYSEKLVHLVTLCRCWLQLHSMTFFLCALKLTQYHVIRNKNWNLIFFGKKKKTKLFFIFSYESISQKKIFLFFKTYINFQTWRLWDQYILRIQKLLYVQWKDAMNNLSTYVHLSETICSCLFISLNEGNIVKWSQAKSITLRHSKSYFIVVLSWVNFLDVKPLKLFLGA